MPDAVATKPPDVDSHHAVFHRNAVSARIRISGTHLANFAPAFLFPLLFRTLRSVQCCICQGDRHLVSNASTATPSHRMRAAFDDINIDDHTARVSIEM